MKEEFSHIGGSPQFFQVTSEGNQYRAFFVCCSYTCSPLYQLNHNCSCKPAQVLVLPVPNLQIGCNFCPRIKVSGLVVGAFR
ncbi:hypothetical protein XELAEV_18037385mg [Xenopus laevis]|uniref:Uncharacterized protein n=1 Tax=Xenopus laevis TaxID=8355 RepID=A0A974CC11_XENLA|nr:hypothetical protein XELAEV_18037385mg [Xenopus laevis]